MALALTALALAGCLDTGARAGLAAPAAAAAGPVGGDGPQFVTDARGCLYEVINGQRYPIVYESGRQQCRT